MTLLNYPYPRNIEEPNVYDTIRVHAEFSTASENLKGPEFSVSTKLCKRKVDKYIFALKSFNKCNDKPT